ncbi:MAG: sulfotransferase domain-containing protein [Desulfosporosinus sp.]|nr:sulfotransferase domain-containing protein [Desulfosporosinus sp.]
MLPNFLCVGAVKAGTTTLHHIIRQHPEVYLPNCKETNFFVNDEYANGLTFYETKYFSKIKNEKVIGEITPKYLYYDSVPERIFESLGPNVKLIFIFRNPVHRAYSQYLMQLRTGCETNTFEKALELESNRLSELTLPGVRDRYNYIDGGLYFKHLKKFLRIFDINNMLFLMFEELIVDPKITFEKVAHFLDIRPYSKMDFNIKSNVAQKPKYQLLWKFAFREDCFTRIKQLGKFVITNETVRRKIMDNIGSFSLEPMQVPEMNEKTRVNLKSIYKSDINELEQFLKISLAHWK